MQRVEERLVNGVPEEFQSIKTVVVECSIRNPRINRSCTLKIGTPLRYSRLDGWFCCYETSYQHGAVRLHASAETGIKVLISAMTLAAYDALLVTDSVPESFLGLALPLAEQIQEAVKRSEEGWDEQTFRLFLKLAGAGLPWAQTRTGTAYQLGLGVEQDTSEGVHWLEEAARQGDPGAYDALALHFTQGPHADPERSELYSRLAAAHGIGVFTTPLGGESL